MVTVQLNDELVAAMDQLDEPIGNLAQELIVMELYRRHVLSRGKAAELLGMSLLDFLRYAAKLGIPYIDMTLEEWEAERRLIVSQWRD
jgi:predicted HTH domain antitoxin